MNSVNETMESLRKRVMNRINRPSEFINEIGMVITEIGDLKAKGESRPSPKLNNTLGLMHGGAIFTLIDSVGGAAVVSTGYGCVTVNCDIHYFRAAKAVEPLFCAATVIKNGRRIVVCDITATDPQGVIVAKATCTYQKTKPLIESVEE